MKFSILVAVVLLALAQGSLAQDAALPDFQAVTQQLEEMKTRLNQLLSSSGGDMATQAKEIQRQMVTLGTGLQENFATLTTRMQEHMVPMTESVQAQVQPILAEMQRQMEAIWTKITEQAKAIEN